MNTVSIIGCGQLGSRHLQGLKTAQTELDIWVMDTNEESLRLARDRYETIQSTTTKQIHYVERIEDLPSEIDLVINASSSRPRAEIIKSLLKHKTIKYLILEKFLFTKLSEYDEIAHLLSEKGVKCWVNCPRRMWDSYREIKKVINNAKPVSLEKRGMNWGMCCNSVHYIDIWMYLSNTDKYDIDLHEVEPIVYNSKRNGYIELFGCEHFNTAKGDTLTLGSYHDFEGDNFIAIQNGDNEIILDEQTGVWILHGERHEARTPYQSSLSGILADSILHNGECSLTPYAISANYHKPYLKEVMNFVNKIKGQNSDSCPIT